MEMEDGDSFLVNFVQHELFFVACHDKSFITVSVSHCNVLMLCSWKAEKQLSTFVF